MQTFKIQSFDNGFQQIIGFTKLSNDPIRIETQTDSAIVVSESTWRDIEETLFLLSINGMRESLLEGKDTPLSDCKTELDW